MVESFGDRKPELEFPCTWTYTVIGSTEERLREVIQQIVEDAEHSVALSNRSKTGKYCSLNVDVLVQTDAQRLAIFQAFHGHRDVKYVL